MTNPYRASKYRRTEIANLYAWTRAGLDWCHAAGLVVCSMQFV